jgi:hypothetical protein
MCSGTGFCPDCQITSLEAELWNSSTVLTGESNAAPSPIGTIPTKSKQICPKCGQAYDGDKCWECVAHKEDIEETLSLCFPIALSGITIGNILAITMFPPLLSNFWLVYMIPALLFVGAILFIIVLGQRMTRYATYVRVTIVLVTVSFVVPAAYFSLNGIIDTNPPIQVPSRVISKGVSRGKYGAVPYLVLSLSWNKVRIKQAIDVSREKLSSAEPGDSVQLVVHPGAFSQPWYGDVLLSSGDTSNSQ